MREQVPFWNAEQPMTRTVTVPTEEPLVSGSLPAMVGALPYLDLVESRVPPLAHMFLKGALWTFLQCIFDEYKIFTQEDGQRAPISPWPARPLPLRASPACTRLAPALQLSPP